MIVFELCTSDLVIIRPEVSLLLDVLKVLLEEVLGLSKNLLSSSVGDTDWLVGFHQ